jgi:hypothetical protein
MIFLDVDGVICNWTLGFARLAKIPPPKFPISGNLEWNWAKERVAPRNIWSYDTDLKFWIDLPVFPYARELVHLVKQYDSNFRFLTSAPEGDCHFYSARAKWIKREFGTEYLTKLIICCKDKSFCAPSIMFEEDNLLIDDKERNIKEFCRNGGQAFHWKEINGLLYSHASVDRYQHQLMELTKKLDKIKIQFNSWKI